MSLTTAINSASSGLRTSQELARITADNVANASSSGYVRREATLVTTSAATGGVRISEVRRDVDLSLQRLSRLESSKMARHQVVQDGLQAYSAQIGQPGDGVSAADRFSAFQNSLTTLVNLPHSNEAQMGAVLAAEDLATTIRAAANQLNLTRDEVDMEIRYEVSDLNQALYQLRDLNVRKTSVVPGSAEAVQYDEQMDILIDQVAGIVDTRVTKSPGGLVSIYTVGGAALLEGISVQDVTFQAGDGTLMAGSQDITPFKAGVRGIQQGSLTGLSDLKRQIIPRFSTQLDEFARGLIQSFETSDQSLAVGQAGLFTDNSAPLDLLSVEGLASRIQVNETLALNGSAEVWRIRDGLGAAAPGDASDASQITAFIDGLDQPLGAASETNIPAFVSVKDFAAEMVTNQATQRYRAEKDFEAASSAAQVVNSARRNSEGVNIDDEMQRLMLIEQSYAANSRILTTVSEMIDTLLRAV